MDTEPATGQRGDRRAAGLAQQQGRARVHVDEDDLADRELRLVLVDQRDDAFMDPAQPFRQRPVAAVDDAAGDVAQPAVEALLDQAEAGAAQPRVDADDPLAGDGAGSRRRGGRRGTATVSAGNGVPR